MNYHVVSNVNLTNEGVYTQPSGGQRTALAYKQGGLDGACAVYSLIICMIRLNYLSQDDVDLFRSSPDCRTPKGKFLHEFLDNNGLVRDGFGFIPLKRAIQNFLGKDFVVTRYAPKTPDDTVQRIVDLLNDDTSPIISINWKSDGAHALLAVGYEYDDNDTVTKILCLDPGSDAPVVSPWNCFIDVRKMKGKYPHKVVTTTYADDGCLDDMIAIEPRIQPETDK